MVWRQAAIVLVTILQLVALMPTLLFFERFAFGDCGWPLTTDALMQEHPEWVPTRDFAYFYGLLTLPVDRAVFAVFGRRPEAVVGIFVFCALAVAVGAARTMAALQLRWLPSLYLIACSALVTIPRGFPSPSHALEAALLMNAIAEHAAGRLNRALVLVLLAVFFKPSLGYVYGLYLVIAILRNRRAGGVSPLILDSKNQGANAPRSPLHNPHPETPRWRGLVPAAITGAFLVAGLSAMYGFETVVRTQLPFTAIEAYRDADFGFFRGVGRGFWDREPSVDFFLNDVAGIWLASSVVLFVPAIRALWKWNEPGSNITVTCALLHAVFVCVLFGNKWSWIYYPYILFVGTAAALNGWPFYTRSILSALFIAVSLWKQDYWVWDDETVLWETWVRTHETGNLCSPPAEAELWGQVRELGRQNPGQVFVLTRMGCPHLIAPELDAPHSWCLIKAIAPPAEMERVRIQIRKANWIVSPAWHDNDLMTWPEFAEELKPFQEEGSTPFFKMYRRVR